jgi:hypothetical protein
MLALARWTPSLLGCARLALAFPLASIAALVVASL